MPEMLAPIGLVGGLALFIVLWDIFGPRGRQFKNAANQQTTRDSPTDDDAEKIPYRASADFSALIDAIRAEGRAYRNEERREDRGKTSREKITIGLLALTVLVVGWQVFEMVRVYGPIKEQADAATLSRRAWLGPLEAKISADLKEGEKVIIQIQYINTGREPGFDLGVSGDVQIFSQSQWDSADAAMAIIEFKTACFGRLPAKGTRIALPQTGSSHYSTYNDTMGTHLPVNKRFTATNGLVNGSEILTVLNCWAYATVNTIHHTSACFYYQAGKVDRSQLLLCNVGNDAD